ncbi:hypothetical protein VQ042_23080 [Aurantimonas sp. A2-1-M11]|uniref:hypothetical protein n=1 Tax=Aurantimonas sp. A2-1-M11 TaxID=3113712 RepID=UPI002F92392D
MTDSSSRNGHAAGFARIARVGSADSASTDAREAQGFLVTLRKQNAALKRLVEALDFERNGRLPETTHF